MFLIKNVYLIDTFLGRVFLKPKLNKSFPCFRFDIYFKINLVLPLEFKVINVKICIRKINNIFQLICPRDLNQPTIRTIESFNIVVTSKTNARKVANTRLFVQRVNVLFVVNIPQNQWFARIVLMICNFYYDKREFCYC